ncbi:hypothetical protein OROHE_009507 [Orobanche hederae]
MKANVLAKYRKWAWHKEIQRASLFDNCKPEDHDVAEPEYIPFFKFYPTFTFGEFDYEEAFEACLKERMGQVAGHLHYDYITWRETGTTWERCINNICEALAADIWRRRTKFAEIRASTFFEHVSCYVSSVMMMTTSTST